MTQKALSVLTTLKKIHKGFSPVQIVVLSFLFVITIGGLLLSLPISHAENASVSVLNAFFTSVSAVCVTGLVTLTTATTWSFFGKIVILTLIQIGGLSLITILAFFMTYTGKKISLKNRLAIQTALNTPTFGGMVRMVTLVIKGAIALEFFGALFLFVLFLSQGIAWHKALFYGIFHSISAFCNAGFDIIGESSLVPYSGAFGINIVVMALIVVGGIGFIVWYDVVAEVKSHLSRRHKKQKSNFSLHTKLALIVTAVLLISGTLFFLATEYNNPKTLGALPFAHKLLASSFQSASLRTAGFATVDQDGLTETSKLFCSLFMIIGGSPGGTAGGVKTVTLAIIFCSVWSIIKGRKEIVAFERTISVATLQRALAVTVLMISLLFAGTIILGITENHTVFPHTVSDLIFEVSSALGTVGLSTGITPHLSGAGKLVLMLCMFIGRIGPITLIISLSRGPQIGQELIKYQSEDVMIG
jgi:trk system potassium uptake protein TrkH